MKHPKPTHPAHETLCVHDHAGSLEKNRHGWQPRADALPIRQGDGCVPDEGAAGAEAVRLQGDNK